MSPEERHILDRTLRLAEENNAILRTMRRYTRIGAFFRILYWTLIIGLSIGAFYFIQPYVEQIFGLYSVIEENVNVVNEAKGSILNVIGQ